MSRRFIIFIKFASFGFVLLIMSSILFSSSPTIAGEPILSPEVKLTTPIFGPDTFNQTLSYAACGDSNCLVLFHDMRPEASNKRYTLVAPDGSILLPVGIPLGSEDVMIDEAAVAWGNGVYLVLYLAYNSGVFFQRIDNAGNLLDATPISLVAGDASPGNDLVAVAFDGTNFLCSWCEDFADPGEAHGAARVTPDGEILDPGGFAIPSDDSALKSLMIAAACGAENCLLIWTEDFASQVAGVRVAFDGTLIDHTPIQISDGLYAGCPAASFDGVNYFVVWHNSHNSDSVTNVYGARVSGAGEVIDPNGFVISPGEGGFNPAVAFDGTNYLVAWNDGDDFGCDMMITRITPTCIILDPAGVKLNPPYVEVGVSFLVYTGLNYLLGWLDSRNKGNYNDNDDVYAARLTPDLEVLDPVGFNVTIGTRRQDATQATFGGGFYWVAWKEENRGVTDYDIYGVRLAPDGTVLDPDGIPISTEAGPDYSPSLACAAANCLIVWQGNRPNPAGRKPYAARLAFDGTVLDPDGIQLSSDFGLSPTVATDGANYLVIWTTETATDDLLGVRVDANGVLLDPAPISIGQPAANGRSKYGVTAAYGAETFFVVWNDDRHGEDSSVYGTAINADGVVHDVNGLQLFRGSDSFRVRDLASDGETFLAVLERNGGSPGNLDIYAALISPTGDVLDPDGIPICTADADQADPRVVFDGQRYLVVWEDNRNEPAQIYGTAVSSSGIVENADGLALSDHLTPGFGPGLAAAAPNRALVAYPAYFPEAPYGETRAVARTFEFTDDDDDHEGDDDDVAADDDDHDDDACGC